MLNIDILVPKCQDMDCNSPFGKCKTPSHDEEAVCECIKTVSGTFCEDSKFLFIYKQLDTFIFDSFLY